MERDGKSLRKKCANWIQMGVDGSSVALLLHPSVQVDCTLPLSNDVIHFALEAFYADTLRLFRMVHLSSAIPTEACSVDR